MNLTHVLGFAYYPTVEGGPAHVAVLIRKRRPEWQAGRLNGVGGKIEPGESADDAMRREWREETGWEGLPMDWRCFLTVSDTNHEQVFAVYTAQMRREDGIALASRHAERRWNGGTEEMVELWQVESLPPDVMADLRWLLPLAIDPDVVDGRLEVYFGGGAGAAGERRGGE